MFSSPTYNTSLVFDIVSNASLVTNATVFRAFVMVCDPQFYVVPKHFHYRPKKPVSLKLTPHCPFSHQPLGPPHLFSVSTDLVLLNISYKWNPTLYDPCVWLLLLGVIFLKLSHVIRYIQILFFLWLTNSPLNVYTTSCLSIRLLRNIQFVSTILLVWMVLVWTWVCKRLFRYLFLVRGMYPGVKFLIPCLTSQETRQLTPFYTSTACPEFQFLHIHINTFPPFFVYNSQKRCFLIVDFSCVSLVTKDIERLFTYTLSICVSSLEK